MRRSTRAVAAVLMLATAPLVMGYEQGDMVVRAGLTTVAPMDDSDKVFVSGLGTTNMEVSVGNNTQLGLNFAYFFSSRWAVEVLAATPFTHTVGLEKSQLGLGDGKLGRVSHLPPTISALYYFARPAEPFQPYIGLGLNYTLFFDEEFKGHRRAQGFSNLDLDNSFGFSGQLGADYFINDNWLINASVRYIDISTTASFNVGGAPGRVNVDIDPWVLTLSAGYRF